MRKKAPNNPIQVNDVFYSKRSGPFKVIEDNGAFDITVQFIETGTVKKTQSAHARSGNLLDPLAKTVFGVGFIGEGNHKSQNKMQSNRAWTVWHTMMARCYNINSKSYKSYGQRGVAVDETWHNFQNFASWFEDNYIEDSDIEKDIIKRGNKVYGPATCRFIPRAINNLLVKPKIKPFGLPRGVTKRTSGRYSSAVSKLNKRIHIGTFDSAHLAFIAYKEAKEDVIKERATEYYERGKLTEDVHQILMNYEIYPY